MAASLLLALRQHAAVKVANSIQSRHVTMCRTFEQVFGVREIEHTCAHIRMFQVMDIESCVLRVLLKPVDAMLSWPSKHT